MDKKSGSVIELADSYPFQKWLWGISVIFTAVVVISSAFHFWPFTDSKIWQMLNMPNLMIILWVAIAAVYFIREKNRSWILSIFPHISIFAFLLINILSISFADSFNRAVNYTVKLIIVFIGGYTLFSYAISNTKTLRFIYRLTVIAAVISVFICLFSRYIYSSENYGFFDNPYKYGTYMGMIVALSASYLLTSINLRHKLLALILVTGALLSLGTAGGIYSIIISMVALVIVVRKWSILIIVTVSLVTAGLFYLFSSIPATLPVREDIKLHEQDNVNLKQRYIEWQAELNLLEERTVTGTAAGCINDYRSYYYYRLPKLNTLNSFDQNSWLATGAETGILGLVCFCWIIVYYFRLAYSHIAEIQHTDSSGLYKYAVANIVGLTGACTSNFFSSVQYNGILIIFVFNLSLITGMNLLIKGTSYVYKENV